MACPRPICNVQAVSDFRDQAYDGVILVTNEIKTLPAPLSCIKTTLEQLTVIDKSCEKDIAVTYCPELPSKCLIFSPTGPLNRDYDDVRNFQEAADKGTKRALKAGCKSPLLIVIGNVRFPLAIRAAVLGALHALYVPLDIREFRTTGQQTLGVWGQNLDEIKNIVDLAQILESGRYVCRDIGGTDPERMAAPASAIYVKDVFKDSCINVSVISDLNVLSKEYPLLVAVNRAAAQVERHQARVIKLEYNGEGPIDKTLMLVGKGITYDTGGADIKYGGSMAGMHRDKCGAAFVAGFFKVLDLYRPKGLKVIGTMAMVRNSVGSESYVSDEIIIARSGKRVRVGNTDAEGRMVMSDPLCEMKDNASKQVNPELFTIATLTGHVVRAYSENYGAVMCNGPARQANIDSKLFDAAERSGDPFEISTIRKEDYKHHSAKTESEDVWQSCGGGSTQTPRGHQAPAAFIIMASGLDKHGIDSEEPLQYSHLDIAGCSGPFPGVPTGSPVLAMAEEYVLSRPSGRK